MELKEVERGGCWGAGDRLPEMPEEAALISAFEKEMETVQ
jgi:hypothetical protein